MEEVMNPDIVKKRKVYHYLFMIFFFNSTTDIWL